MLCIKWNKINSSYAVAYFTAPAISYAVAYFTNFVRNLFHWKRHQSFSIDAFFWSEWRDLWALPTVCYANSRLCSPTARELQSKSRRSRVYHQFRRNCISPKGRFVYHHWESNATWRLMIYAYGNDIHAKAWWYTIAFAMDKKEHRVSDALFWSEWRDLWALPTVCYANTRLCSPSAREFKSPLKKKQSRQPKGYLLYLVRVARLELTASWPPVKRATNCATPG